MKNDLISLLINEVCQVRMCENCNFWKLDEDGCYLIDIIEIIENYKKENDKYEK